ncbi:MAG: PadR family transcriptional regulator [Actinobacteria bacterium]|nr:PadR family transcriptional regulator [Actinomycetota bacterium]
MERFFEYGELPLVLLALLKQRAMSGYELMSELARLFSPQYTPSAGSVYPALVGLEKEQLIQAVDSASPKRYLLSSTGEGALQNRLDELGWIERRTGAFLRPEGSVDGELERLIGLVKESRGKIDPGKLLEVLDQAQSQVKRLVRLRGGD